MRKIFAAMLGLTMTFGVMLVNNVQACSTTDPACFSGASAVSFTDVVTFSTTGTIEPEAFIGNGSGAVNFLSGSGDYVRWKHLYLFSPPLDNVANSILTATLKLSLRDDRDCTSEYAFLWTEPTTTGATIGTTKQLGEVDTEVIRWTLSSLSRLVDGSFEVKLSSLCGDFYIDKSELFIKYCPEDSQPVPEPGTIVLLGAGLFGLGIYGRRRSRK